LSRVVIGVFNEQDAAEQAVKELKGEGFEQEVSLIAKDDRQTNQEETGAEVVSLEEQDLSEGTVTGGVIGGVAGLLAGAGALLIPGIGPVIAAGPLASTLTGIVTGGIAGGLVDYGVPEERGEYYEEQVRQGSILITLRSSDENVEEAASIMRSHGAEDVESHVAG